MTMLIPNSNDLEDYLASTDIIDSNDPKIKALSQDIISSIKDPIKQITAIYEYVRDQISHSFDINGKNVTCRASETLQHQEGICFAKSHLLAALLRCAGFPTGFCYQTLILDDVLHPYLTYHGLNAVFIQSIQKWVRLDARGNKTGVQARFSLEDERLAFDVREEYGEENLPTIYVDPLPEVIQCLNKSKNMDELRANLPKPR